VSCFPRGGTGPDRPCSREFRPCRASDHPEHRPFCGLLQKRRFVPGPSHAPPRRFFARPEGPANSLHHQIPERTINPAHNLRRLTAPGGPTAGYSPVEPCRRRLSVRALSFSPGRPGLLVPRIGLRLFGEITLSPRGSLQPRTHPRFIRSAARNRRRPLAGGRRPLLWCFRQAGIDPRPPLRIPQRCRLPLTREYLGAFRASVSPNYHVSPERARRLPGQRPRCPARRSHELHLVLDGVWCKPARQNTPYIRYIP